MANADFVRESPFIIVNDGIIVKLSQSFIDMTEFQTEDLVNQDLEYLFKILRIGPDFNYEAIDESAEYFLFTKLMEVRFANIQLVIEGREKCYVFSEISNSRFEVRFPVISMLCADNYYGVGIYSMPDKTLLKANDKYISFFDEPFNKKENCIGKCISKFIKNYKESDHEKIMDSINENKKPYISEEYKYTGFKRGVTYWKFSVIPVCENNKVKYCSIIVTDITEQVLHRKKIEQQTEIIEQQNSRLKWQAGLLNLCREPIFAWMLDGGIIYWNKGAEQKYGYTREEVLGCDSQMLLRTIYPQEFHSIRSKMLDDGIWRGKIERTRKDGAKLIVEASHQVIVEENGYRIVIETDRDITQDVENHKMIKRQKEELNAIINSMQDGLEIVNCERKVKILNQSAKNFFFGPELKAKSGDSLKRNKYFYGIDGNELRKEDLPAFKVLREGNFENYVLTVVQPDKKVYVNVNGSIIRNEDGMAQEAVLSIRNITNHIMQEKAIAYHQQAALDAEREKNEALEKAIEMKDEFLSLISHEFRTPLNVINAAVQAINYLCSNELSERTKKYINTIRQNTFRQLRLVNNLLDITRADAGTIKLHKKNIDIVFLTNSIVESVQTYAAQKEVNLTFTSSVSKKVIGMDDEKYERILLNLLSNAIKFTPEGKLITVNLQVIENNIAIEVKDNGIGIPQDKVDVIFERFGQVDSSLSRQAEGAGIGLSLVKKLVDAMGGSISVKSKEGIGSTFIVYLPSVEVSEEEDRDKVADLLDNHLVQVTRVEFSDIYL